MKEVKLTAFPDSLEYRFLTAPGSHAHPAAPLDDVLADARRVDAARVQRVTIAGGSPLRHPRFVEMVNECRALGLNGLALETDAAPLQRRGVSTLLARLGFRELFVVMGGLHAPAHEAVLRERDTLPAALEGLTRALTQARAGGPRVYIVVPLLRANRDDVAPLLEWAIGVGGLQGFLLALPEIARVPAAQRDQLLSYSAQAEVAARIFQRCHAKKIEYGFSTKRGILPCASGEALEPFATVFYDRSQFFRHAPRPRREAELARIEACAECSLSHSCDGVEMPYLEHFGTAEFHAVPLERSMGWKLRRINRLEEFEYRNISPFTNDSPVNPRGLIRINGHCNMSCAFCFVDRTAPDFDVDQLEQEIAEMARGGTRHLVISGGEPTLHKRLPELIRFARDQGVFDVIEMQSNGVKCADFDYARELVEAGLNKVTFSLHSVDPEHSDAITRLPHAFGRTIQAIHNFRQLGVLTQIAHVLTKANYRELPDTVRYLRREFPAESGHLSICLAIAQGISDLVFQWVIPTFSEIKPYVADALDYCLEHDVGFGGMIGQGGYPPCMLDGELRYYRGVLDKVFRSSDSSDQFYKSEKCKECSFDAFCLGPRRSYVEHYGEDEIRPFRVDLDQLPVAPAGARVDYSAEAASLSLAGAVAPAPTAAPSHGPLPILK
ncbi:radical SAM protein [bacterium]|nr:radical SAM protein [bacterium]